MNYCEKRKLAFFMPPRNGTTTFSYFLNNWGLKHLYGGPLNNRHISYDEALELFPELANYKCYGFYRDPLSRFLSAYSSMDRKVEPKVFSPSDAEYSLFIPQYTFLSNCELLDHSNFNNEILKIAGWFNQSVFVIPKSNYSKQKETVVPNEIVDFVKEYYAEDYKLGERLNKGIA